MQFALFGNSLDLLEYGHRLRAMHVSITRRNRNGTIEGVGCREIDFMPYSLAVQIIEVGRNGIVVVYRIEIQATNRIYIAPNIEVLELSRLSALKPPARNSPRVTIKNLLYIA